MRIITSLLALAAAVWLTGCSSTYVTPSGRANFNAFSSPTMKASFEAKPAATFPAGIATVRVQAPQYYSYYAQQEGSVYGGGGYSIITSKEVEDDSDIQRIAKLPQVSGMFTLNRLLLPQNLNSDNELREAAARLKADMVVIYTFDTSFHDNDSLPALPTITLGLLPTRRIHVTVAASALVMDTRTGFIYAALEANEKREVQTSAWGSRESADKARQDAERAAFKGLVDEFVKNWPQVVERAGKGA